MARTEKFFQEIQQSIETLKQHFEKKVRRFIVTFNRNGTCIDGIRGNMAERPVTIRKATLRPPHFAW